MGSTSTSNQRTGIHKTHWEYPLKPKVNSTYHQTRKPRIGNRASTGKSDNK